MTRTELATLQDALDKILNKGIYVYADSLKYIHVRQANALCRVHGKSLTALKRIVFWNTLYYRFIEGTHEKTV